MAEDLPSPPVPAEVSMSGNEWFPLYYQRLRKSRWWRSASDFARSRNIDLWCASFDETPAGSLPDDDIELADAAGFGRDVAEFQAHKAELMAPWTLCTDSRWYHPTVCEVVLETWERTSERRKQDRLRQQARRARTRISGNAPSATLSAVTRDAPTRSRVTPPSVTREVAPQDKTRQDRDITVASAAPNATAAGEPWKGEPEFLAVWDAATPQMRRRAKSMAKAWAEWVKVRKTAEPGKILAGLRGYLRGDPDVQRTGGPGLQNWLRDRTFEQWATAADPTANWTPDQWAAAVAMWRETGRWGESLGPEPGEPGCKAPAAVLARHGVGVALAVVNGGAA
jgi:hypothetical protein